MATVALGAAGAALGGPVGQFVGASLGSYIDNALIMPALFPQDPVQGPRIEDLRVHSSSEGTPYTHCLGPQNRVGGTIIWSTDLKEVSEEVGGKGGSAPEQVTYEYFVDIAVAWCEGPTDGLGIHSVDRILTDVKILYDETPDVDISSDQLSAQDSESTTIVSIVSGSTLVLESRFTLRSPSGGPDLSELRSGYDADVDGFAETSLNGTWRCISSSLDDTTLETFATFKREDGGAFADDANGGANTITVFQDLPKFLPANVQAVTNYLGTEAQTADPLIEAAEGAGEVPGFRGMAYSTMQNLALKPHGNRIPNFEAYIIAAETETAEGAIGEILARAGRDPSEYDASALSAVDVQGYSYRDPQPAKSLLQPLQIAYDIVAQEADGVLTFFLRSNAAEVPIDEDDLATHAFGSDTDRPFLREDLGGRSLPRQVNVDYVDPKKHLLSGSQAARKLLGDADGVVNVELPLVLTAEEARNIAERLLWTPYANRHQITLALPPSYVGIQENDVLTFTALGRDWRVLVLNATEGHNGMIEVVGVQETAALLDFDVPAEDPAPSKGGEVMDLPPELRLHLIDVGALRDEDTTKPGFYLAAAAPDPLVPWNGATVYEQVATGGVFLPHLSVLGEARQGVAITSLGAPAVLWLWDRASTVRVRLDDGTLASATEDEVLGGANRILVGQEVIGFATATLVAAGEWELSDLLRGLAGTEAYVDLHAVGDRVVLLTDPGVEFSPAPATQVGTDRAYQAVPAGGVEGDYGAQSLTLAARCAIPADVVLVGAERHEPSTNDWTVTFWRRTRLQVDPLFSDSVPLQESAELYEIDVLDYATGDVVATYEHAEDTDGVAATFVYTEAQQVADFGSAQSQLRVVVYQVSPVLGRGKPTEFLTP